MASRAGSKALIREINEALVLSAVRRRGGAARSEIVQDTGLSAATVTGITAHLVEDGLLDEQRTAPGARGRPARLLQLSRDAVFAAGVQIMPGSLRVVIADLHGGVRAERYEQLDVVDPEAVAEAAVDAVRRAWTVPIGARIHGIGVAVSGVVDFDAGVVRHSGALKWSDVRLAAQIQRRAPGVVTVDSLVNCYATSRLADDPSLTEQDVLILSVGTSIGASFVASGDVQRGHQGSAGGFAHTRVVERVDGRPCHCGDSDCLEAWSSGWGMGRERARRAGEGATVAAVRAEAGQQLGAAAANAAKILGPQRVICTFFPELYDDETVENTRDTFGERFRHAITPPPKFESAVADGSDIARGAAYTALSGLFAPHRN